MSPDYARVLPLLRAMADKLGAAWPTPVWVDEGIGKAEEWMWEQEEER